MSEEEHSAAQVASDQDNEDQDALLSEHDSLPAEPIKLTDSKNKGVCYFPTIPPYMNPNHLRKLLA